ncbi:MAG: GNAT family N-acetyltransferase [Limisphaerales bacterium]
MQSRGSWDEVFQRRYTAENLPHTQLLLVDDKPVGWIAVRNDPHALDILDIHILPSHQKQGLGTSVLRHVLEDASRQRKLVKLSVLKINPSRSLYERLGFRITGETESHWLMEHDGSR